MKKFLFTILLNLILLVPITVYADFDAYVKMSGSTSGGVTYTLYKDGKLIFDDKSLSAPTYSATVTGHKDSLQAYCLQSNLAGPDSGAWYTCTEGLGNDYGAIINAGISAGLSQQEIEYAVKVAAARNGDNSGEIVSGHSSADSNGHPIYRILANVGTSAIGKRVPVSFGNYEIEVKDPGGVYAAALGIMGSGGSGTSANSFKITSKNITCGGSSCTAIIKYNPATAIKSASDVKASSGRVTFAPGTITITGISAKDGCGSVAVEIKYSNAGGWARCSAKTGSTTMQNMIIQSPESATTKINLSACDDENCKIQGEAVAGCLPEAEIKESDYFKTCIIDKNDCQTKSYNIVTNKYCKIACKEDIKMIFPTTILGANGETGKVFSGRYFTLNTTAKVEGKKTCVTGGTKDINNIRWEDFLTDVYGSTTENANGGLNKAYKDAHNRYVAYVKAIATSWSSGTNSSGTCCTSSDPESCKSNPDYNYTVAEYSKSAIVEGQRASAYYQEIIKGGSKCSGAGLITRNEAEKNLTNGRDSALAARDNAKNNILQSFRDIKQCTEFADEIKYVFEPEMTFEYDEPYSADVGFTTISSSGPGITEVYCNQAATDPEFKCSGGGTTAHKNVTIYNCSGENSCVSQSGTLDGTPLYYYNQNRAVKKVIEASKEWSNTTYFYTMVPSGAITRSSGSNRVAIGEVYPVSIATPKGNYEYRIIVTGLGENKKFDACLDGENILACPYTVENEIVTPGKPGDGKGAGINFFYRPIELGDVFPNSNTSANEKNLINFNYRTIGSNWASAKGQETEKEIEKMGEDVYLPSTNKANKNELVRVQYSYTITARQMAKLRSYNREREKLSKGYADFELACNTNTANIPDGLECISKLLKGETNTCGKDACFTDNLNNDPATRNVSFIRWIDNTAWK